MQTDSENLIYHPYQVKIIIASLIGASFVTALFVAVSFVGRDGMTDWILFSLSFAQVTLVGLIVGIVAAYSEREAGIAVLREKARQFLEETLLQSLRLVTVQPDRDAVMHQLSLGTPLGGASAITESDIFGRVYRMELVSPGVPPVPVKFWFGLNVFRLFCIYCLPVEPQHPGFRAWSDA